MLSAELIHRIGRLVRPRHYWKLICCCKLFRKALDIDEYWFRLAVFMHARYSISYESYSCDPLKYVESYVCGHIFDMMCHSGTYEHVMNTMLSKARDAYPDEDDAGLLKTMVAHRLRSIKRIEELSSSAKKEALRPRDAARRDWMSKIRCIELKIYEGWESFTLKQLAKSQVDVDFKRLTIPYKFNMLKFRAFFRAMEDDSSLSLAQKRHVWEFMHGGLIMCDIRKEKLLEKEFTTTWPTRKQLVKAGFLCVQGYEPVHMFQILGRHFTKELFAYMAPKIQAFMHDMRGSKCMFDIDYDALSSHVLYVPIHR